jgi:hypothetical protein
VARFRVRFTRIFDALRLRLAVAQCASNRTPESITRLDALLKSRAGSRRVQYGIDHGLLSISLRDELRNAVNRSLIFYHEVS